MFAGFDGSTNSDMTELQNNHIVNKLTTKLLRFILTRTKKNKKLDELATNRSAWSVLVSANEQLFFRCRKSLKAKSSVVAMTEHPATHNLYLLLSNLKTIKVKAGVNRAQAHVH